MSECAAPTVVQLRLFTAARRAFPMCGIHATKKSTQSCACRGRIYQPLPLPPSLPPP
eukprot:CAMPEP_0177339322 /NCGR_PEP_ID=MMETSP0368-20130122/25338_1 /TAXON_ID=447022 ORGANISM="Scrippsiella hangoei-like, Strain SHHI-4" /NCGR_SAMPLE_ID=MMETSP0368 /ASSEMBLY_ACC=CAM_ASM_000363 /LENGTH=56 /DNA_ID=CAMNT_0018800395 /DNA_START=85 /DNA_END=251 /DNA_ORIENTATION=+